MSRTKIAAAFRPVYKELSQTEKDTCDRIKSKAADLAVELFPNDGREKAIAMTKLEECVMWAIKGVTAP